MKETVTLLTVNFISVNILLLYFIKYEVIAYERTNGKIYDGQIWNGSVVPVFRLCDNCSADSIHIYCPLFLFSGIGSAGHRLLQGIFQKYQQAQCRK
jgi:hypothetical protein